jgi:hypothetical protein
LQSCTPLSDECVHQEEWSELAGSSSANVGPRGLARWRLGDNCVAMPENQSAPQDTRAEFIAVSVWHGSLDRAREVLGAHPEVASSDIHTAALLGDHEAVARFLAEDPANATAKGGPRNWDALTHLCLSKFLRLEPARTVGFLKAALALLVAGANPNTRFFEETHQPKPEWECALCGAIEGTQVSKAVHSRVAAIFWVPAQSRKFHNIGFARGLFPALSHMVFANNSRL